MEKTGQIKKIKQNYKTIAAVLAIVSFYTTLEGLKSYVFNGDYTWQAVFISIAVQCLLFMLSMEGFNFRYIKKEPFTVLAKTILCLVLLTISSFFSFVFMSNTIYEAILEQNMINTIESKYYEYNIEYSQYLETVIPKVKESLINDVSQLITETSSDEKKDIDYTTIKSKYSDICSEYGIIIDNIENGTNTTDIEDIISNLKNGVSYIKESNEDTKSLITTMRKNGNTDDIKNLEEEIKENNEKISKINDFIIILNSIKLENNQTHKYLLSILSEIESKNQNTKNIQDNMDKLRESIYSLLTYDENDQENFIQCMKIYSQVNTTLEKYETLYTCKINLSTFNDNFNDNQPNNKDSWIEQLDDLKNILGSTPYFEEDNLFYDTVNNVNKINDIIYEYSDGVNDAQKAITLFKGRNNGMAIFALMMAVSLDVIAIFVGKIQRSRKVND